MARRLEDNLDMKRTAGAVTRTQGGRFLHKPPDTRTFVVDSRRQDFRTSEEAGRTSQLLTGTRIAAGQSPEGSRIEPEDLHRKPLGNIQGDQLNMAVFFWYLVKSDCLVYMCKVAYTEQATFYKLPEKPSHV